MGKRDGREDTRYAADNNWGYWLQGMGGGIQGIQLTTTGVDGYRVWKGGYKGWR